MVKKVGVKASVKGKKSGSKKKVAKVKEAVVLDPDFNVVSSGLSVTEVRVKACGWAQDVNGSL